MSKIDASTDRRRRAAAYSREVTRSIRALARERGHTPLTLGGVAGSSRARGVLLWLGLQPYLLDEWVRAVTGLGQPFLEHVAAVEQQRGDRW